MWRLAMILIKHPAPRSGRALQHARFKWSSKRPGVATTISAPQPAAGGPAGAVARRRRARWTSSRSTPPSRATGTSSAGWRRARCCSARSTGPQHTLVGRPSQDCVLRRIPLRELYRPEYATYATGRVRSTYARRTRASTPPARAAGPTPSPLEHAFALGIGRSLRVLFQAPLDGRPAAARPWPTTTSCGCRCRPAACSTAPRTARRRRATCWSTPRCGSRWSTSSTGCCPRVDRWIEQLERAHEDRTAAGIKAGEAVRARADQALLASIGRPARAGRAPPARRGDRRRHVRRLPARRARPPGSRSPSPPKGGAAERPRRPGRARSRSPPAIRTRAVRLDGRWWRDERRPAGGPPGPVRRAGRAAVAARRYEAVNPASGRGYADRQGQRGGVRAARRDVLPPAARTADDRAGGCCASACAAPAGTCATCCSRAGDGGARRAGADRDRQGARRVRAEGAEKSLIVQVSLAVMVTSVVAAAFMLLQNLTILRMEGRIESDAAARRVGPAAAAADEVLHRALHRRAGQRGHGHQRDPPGAVRHRPGGRPGDARSAR